ncbi:MAG: hypothetical protein AVDCRST_MAG06-511 [uncultured Nocardioides sp.]|uniref:Uncharacterized protein n=1 Tax=uncultured Nocardioides sp. TaxID=198441 RepID=A0A6J4N303_9ACTN|nr:MAG: hypothetical protein AVDCRST_MAG06-511 [uncultured Nocardioides sp.]
MWRVGGHVSMAAPPPRRGSTRRLEAVLLAVYRKTGQVVLDIFAVQAG